MKSLVLFNFFLILHICTYMYFFKQMSINHTVFSASFFNHQLLFRGLKKSHPWICEMYILDCFDTFLFFFVFYRAMAFMNSWNFKFHKQNYYCTDLNCSSPYHSMENVLVCLSKNHKMCRKFTKKKILGRKKILK